MPVAVVTGASSGIGAALLPRFAADRCELVVVARRAELLEEQARRLRDAHGARVHVVALDLSAPGAAAELFSRTQALGLDVDTLVNNAGFAMFGPFADMNPARVTQMLQLNVVALTELTHVYLAPMVRRRAGRVLQVASTASFQPGPHLAAYYATKAYVLSFSEAIAKELEGTGVTVTALCPGPTRSEFNDVAGRVVSGAEDRMFMDADDVAEAGYRAMLRGDRVCVPGALNRIGAVGAQLAPRSLVLSLTERLMRGR